MSTLFIGNSGRFVYDDSLLHPLDIEDLRTNPTMYSTDELREMWKRAFSPGEVCLDIGAFLGSVSVNLAFLGGIVYAVEGSKRHSDKLVKLMRRLPDITVVPVALSNENKIVTTKFNDCLGPREEYPDQPVQYVIFDEHPVLSTLHPRFVKMDIEGMESLALHGMRNVIEKDRPVWQIECHPHIEYKNDGYPGYVPPRDGGFDVEPEFRSADYSIINEKMEPVNIDGYGNYFFIPNERINNFKI